MSIGEDIGSHSNYSLIHPTRREVDDSPKAYILQLTDTREERSKVARRPHRPAQREADGSPKACVLQLADTREEKSKRGR
jgi:hypothetical protein